jgi:hypothetical protein
VATKGEILFAWLRRNGLEKWEVMICGDCSRYLTIDVAPLTYVMPIWVQYELQLFASFKSLVLAQNERAKDRRF